MLSDYQTLLDRMVRDDNNVISLTDIDAAIQLAVVRYSNDFPLSKVADLAANGTSSILVPNDWVVGFSDISVIEYPIGDFPPDELDNDEYCLYRTPTMWAIQFSFIPVESLRITYSLPHTVSDVVDTINPHHREAVTLWAAAFCCDQLASYYASASDNTIQADHVQRNSQSADYAHLAKNFRSRYFSELGIKEDRKIGASAVVDLNLKNSFGQDRFTHPNRFR